MVDLCRRERVCEDGTRFNLLPFMLAAGVMGGLPFLSETHRES